MSTYTMDESSIKRRIISLIRTFRSLGFLNDSDVKISSLQMNTNNQYEVVGEYAYTPILKNDIAEQGTFNITLERQNLTPFKVNISPKPKTSL